MDMGGAWRGEILWDIEGRDIGGTGRNDVGEYREESLGEIRGEIGERCWGGT